jgi:Flp pilus assembly CpaE family ATPase
MTCGTGRSKTRLVCRATTALREKGHSGKKAEGKLLVLTGSKGGSGVTTVACNIAIALAQSPDQRVLLIDLALPIGDAALCLGIAAGYSTDYALQNIDRLDAALPENIVAKHRSGVFVLAAPTQISEVEASKSDIEKLMAIARSEFDLVIVDAGSRIDAAAKALFEHASIVYLVTQTGISELRNSNRVISQFFAEGSSDLEIVVNRFDSRFHETANEDVIVKALGRPVASQSRAIAHSPFTRSPAQGYSWVGEFFGALLQFFTCPGRSMGSRWSSTKTGQCSRYDSEARAHANAGRNRQPHFDSR